MRVLRLIAAMAIVVPGAAGCHGKGAVQMTDPMLEALRAQSREAGLGYAEAQGKHLFDRYCATCHGDGGKGDGQNASNLTPPPPDLTAPKRPPDQGDLRKVIAEGSAAMGRSPLSPPYGRSLSAQEIDYLTLYCRALARPAPKKQGGGG